MQDFLFGLSLGLVIVGAWAYFEVRQYQFNSIQYRRELKGFYKQNNVLIEGLADAGCWVLKDENGNVIDHEKYFEDLNRE